jgi:hypothetical protein
MAFKFNPKSYEEEKNDFAPIPVGFYTVKIVEAAEKVSKASGKDMIALTVQIIEGKQTNRKLWQYIVENEFTNKTIGNILDAIGIDTSQARIINAKLFLGGIACVKVKHDKEGKEKISYWKSLEGLPEGSEPKDNSVSNDFDDDIPF